MKTRIIQISSQNCQWYEVQVRILGFIWIDANVYKYNFPQAFTSLEDAMNSLDKLKKPIYQKKVIANIDL